MSARQWNRSYESHAEFYQDVYGTHLAEQHRVGRPGAALLLAHHQTAGDWSDAPSPDLVIAFNQSSSVSATMNLGSGRFRGEIQCGDFVVIPPGCETTVLMDDRHSTAMLAIPYESLVALAGGTEVSGLPRDGNFGRLHGAIQRNRTIVAPINGLWDEARAGTGQLTLAADGLLLQLAGALLSLAGAGPPRPAKGGLAPWQVRRVCDFIQSDLAADIGLAELAAILDLSPEHFCRAFKASTGLPPHSWLVQRRVERARELLAETRLTIDEIAFQVGYAAPSHLARVFRRQHGVSPAEYRRSNARRGDPL